MCYPYITHYLSVLLRPLREIAQQLLAGLDNTSIIRSSYLRMDEDQIFLDLVRFGDITYGLSGLLRFLGHNPSLFPPMIKNSYLYYTTSEGHFLIIESLPTRAFRTSCSRACCLA